MNHSDRRPDRDEILLELQDEFLEENSRDDDSVEFGIDGIPAIEGFEKLELVGVGGMGTVYSGVQTKLDRRVAIKILWPNLGGRISTSLMRRFDEECKLLAKLDHPNIVRVLHAGECTLEDRRVRPFFAMDFVEGADLRSLLERGWPTIDTTLSIMKQLCEGLRYAHAQGVIHRDIKPENILLENSGVLKIVDFGIGRNQNRTHRMTTHGASPGTPGYTAPEVFNGEAADERSDVYSCGVVFYELLTGTIPTYGAYESVSTIRANLDARWDTVIEKAVTINRNERFASVSVLGEAIKKLPTVEEDTPQTLVDGWTVTETKERMATTTVDAAEHSYKRPVQDLSVEKVADNDLTNSLFADKHSADPDRQRAAWRYAAVDARILGKVSWDTFVDVTQYLDWNYEEPPRVQRQINNLIDRILRGGIDFDEYEYEYKKIHIAYIADEDNDDIDKKSCKMSPEGGPVFIRFYHNYWRMGLSEAECIEIDETVRKMVAPYCKRTAWLFSAWFRLAMCLIPSFLAVFVTGHPYTVGAGIVGAFGGNIAGWLLQRIWFRPMVKHWARKVCAEVRLVFPKDPDARVAFGTIKGNVIFKDSYLDGIYLTRPDLPSPLA